MTTFRNGLRVFTTPGEGRYLCARCGHYLWAKFMSQAREHGGTVCLPCAYQERMRKTDTETATVTAVATDTTNNWGRDD